MTKKIIISIKSTNSFGMKVEVEYEYFITSEKKIKELENLKNEFNRKNKTS